MAQQAISNWARASVSLTLAFLVLPLASGLLATVLPAFGYMPALGGNDFGLAYFASLISQPGIIHSALISLLSGLVAALISTAAVAVFLAAYAGTGKFARLQHSLSALLAVPHAATAFGIAFLLAPSGWLVRLFAPLAGLQRPPDVQFPQDPYALALVIGLIAKEIPFLLLAGLNALAQVPLSPARILAGTLGYGKIEGFFYLVWPAIYRQMRFAIFAVIAFSTSVVDMALILGPDLPATLASRLVRWMGDPDLQYRFLAAAGAMLQLVVTCIAIAIWLVAERLGSIGLAFLRDRGWRQQHDGMYEAGSGLVVMSAVFLVAGGLFALLVWSFAGLWQFPDLFPSGMNAKTWSVSLARAWIPLVNTVGLAFASTSLALVLTIGCLEHEFQTGRNDGNRHLLVLYLPLIIPQISFVFGLQILFLASSFEHRAFALVLVHLVFVLPYVFLTLSPPWRAFDRRYDLVCETMGHSRSKALLGVRLPMLARPLLAAFAVGFSVSVGQYLPTVLIGEGRISTIATEAVALASGGNRRVIGVYALLQTMLPFIAFALATLVPALLFRRSRSMQV